MQSKRDLHCSIGNYTNKPIELSTPSKIFFCASNASSNYPGCRRNEVDHNSSLEWSQKISVTSYWVYYVETLASLNQGFRTAHTTAPPVFPTLEIHSPDHISRNDTRKLACSSSLQSFSVRFVLFPGVPRPERTKSAKNYLVWPCLQAAIHELGLFVALSCKNSLRFVGSQADLTKRDDLFILWQFIEAFSQEL